MLEDWYSSQGRVHWNRAAEHARWGGVMELEVLGDRYEMQEPIGRGGMATIYRAVDLRMGRV